MSSTPHESARPSIAVAPTGPPAPARTAFARVWRRWLDLQSADEAFRVHLGGRATLIRTLVSGSIVAVAIATPTARAVFGLDPWPAIAAHTASLAVAAAAARSTARPTRWTWLACLAVASLVVLKAALLAAFATQEGAIAFSGLVLMACYVHGRALRATPTEPLPAVAFALAVAVAAAVAPTPEARAVLAVALPAGVAITLHSGYSAVRSQRDETERDRLRAAVEASALAERRSRRVEYEPHVVGDGDLEVLLRSVSEIGDQLARRAATDPRLRALSADLDRSLSHLAEVVRGEPTTDTGFETANLRDVIASVAAAFRQQHPHARLVVDVDPSEPAVCKVSGGAESLARVVQHLLANAGEGDGERSASEIFLRVTTLPATGRLVLEIADDGPGFPEGLVSGRIEPFRTDRKGATGLGLYIVDRLVRASGGTWRRGNRPTGGACVRVELLLHPTET